MTVAFRQRSQEAPKQKGKGARVGVAAGDVKVGRDRIEKNPDQRVSRRRACLHEFAEFKSARQTHIWLRDQGIELPAKSRRGRRTASCGAYRPTTSCTTS